MKLDVRAGHVHAPNPNDFAATKSVTPQKARDGSDEAANLVDANNSALHRRVRVAIHLGVHLQKGRERQQTAHDTLVIAEQDKTNTSSEGHHEIQLGAGEAEEVRMPFLCHTRPYAGARELARYNVDASVILCVRNSVLRIQLRAHGTDNFAQSVARGCL